MIEIKDLLLNLKNTLLAEGYRKEEIRRIISEQIKIQIETKDIERKNGIIYLNIKPIYKNEIFLKKEQIFSELKKTLGQKSPSDFK